MDVIFIIVVMATTGVVAIMAVIPVIALMALLPLEISLKQPWNAPEIA